VTPLDDSAFPLLFQSADKSSLAGQRKYLRRMRFELTALVVAAAFGAFAWKTGNVDVAGIVAAVAFAAALVAEIMLVKERPDRSWYTGRAIAESAKTLAWRYMMGASPFGVAELSPAQADIDVLERFADLTREASSIKLSIPDSGETEQITDAMRAKRALPLADRRAIYLEQRIKDQVNWYARKATWNDKRASFWSFVLSAGTLIGFVCGVLKATGIVNVDLLGVVAAIVAAIAAWTQTKQHQNLASAYSVAAQELSIIAGRAKHITEEEDWARFVADAEEAVSREHTMWTASHN